MPVLGCGAEMAKLMDVANDDVATIEEVIAERLALGVSQAQAQRQAVDEALAQLAAERSMVMKAVQEQLGQKEEAEPVFSNRVPPAQAKKLEAGKKVTLYRAMSMIDGKLYPPMSAKMTDAQGNLSLRNPEPVGVWMRSEERPDMVPASGANAGMFPLKKPGGGTTWALYAPYFHASPIPLNDQFTAAWKNDGVERPQLVTVEVEVPASEMTSGYQAEGSVKKVGPNKWNSGVVASKVPGGREVVLSRYIKIKRVVPDAEVAQKIAAIVNPNRLSIPENTVTPQLRAELEKQGVRIAPQGTRGDDIRFSNKALDNSELPEALALPNYEEGAMGENGAYRTSRTDAKEEGYRARGLEPIAAGGVGEIWVKPDEAAFIRSNGFGRSHLNQTALHAYQVAQAGYDPDLIRENFVDEMVNNLDQDAGAANDRFDELRSAAVAAAQSGKPVFSNKSTIGFYSALADSIDNMPTKSSTAQGWKDAIKGLINKGAVKADEVEWTGLNDWLDLQQGKVSKEQIGEYLAANGVQVEEVTLTDEESGMAVDDWLENWAENNPGPTADAILDGEPWDQTRKIAKENGDTAVLNRIERKIYPAKYSQYTLPGGENYREVLLTLPTKKSQGFKAAIKAYQDRYGVDAETAERELRGADQSSGMFAIPDDDRSSTSSQYNSSHWDQPNVLAHIRLNDRTDADGKRVLFVEEIQSDWGQEGKKGGFNKPLVTEEAITKEFGEWWVSVPGEEDGVPFATQREARAYLAELNAKNAKGVPTAPFVTKTEGWLNLALKRIITMAAEGGYDRVAFVNGEQSADRFSLDKHIDKLQYTKNENGLYDVFANKDGAQVISESSIGLDRVEELLGKETAEKIAAGIGEQGKDFFGRPTNSKVLKGDNLKVEAKGMRAFYDSIVPKATNELLRKLKTGAKLGEVAITGNKDIRKVRDDDGTYAIEERREDEYGSKYWEPIAYNLSEQEANDRLKADGRAAQPGFDVTDAMREKAAEGMPLFANKARPAPLAEETRWQAFRRVIQDQYLPVLKVQEALISGGGTVTPQLDVYRAEERMHGRAQEKLIDFGRNLLEPLLKKAADFGIELDELALYAYAKFAGERNAHIDEINPVMRGAGSGMDDATAQNILQMVQLAGDQAKFDELHADLMRLTEATRQEYLRSGLISQETYDAWTSNYENYVPLRGFENVDDEGKARPGVGSGLSIKGKESLRALGRRSRAADIIENIVAEHERAVLRGERNNVAKTFLALAQANPNPALWEIQPRKLQRSFDRSRDLVVYNQAPDTTDTIGAKVGGQQVYVKVRDPLLLRSLTQAGKDKAGALHGTVVRTLGMYTNLLRNTLTRYNPVFGAINAVRDAPMGALSAYDTLGGEGAKLYAKYYTEAMAASWRHERGAPNLSKDMDRWLKEMRLAGGTTSGVYMRDVEEIKGDLRMMMLQAGAAPKNLREKMLAGKPAKAAHAALHWLEIVGSTSEDAARLAAYRAAREVGKSAAEAASIAKNLTTNFNRSGEWGASINGLYLFFNAGVQGTTRLAQALKNPRVQAVLAAGVAGAAAVALANASVGGDDEDGVPYWEKIPDYEKERNLIVMLPPGVEMDGATEIGKKARYIKIPVQYGLNMFMVLGYQIADLARHVKDPARGVSPEKAAINMTSAVFGSINPFGGALDPTDPIQVGMALLPTAGDTALQLMSGTNAFGRPVGPAKGAYDTKPDSETYSPAQAGTASQRLAGWLNSVTGGNEGRSGAIDVMPGTLDNVVRNTTGGLGMFVSSLVNLPIKAWHVPENVGPKDTPFWRNLYGELTAASEVGRFYENRGKAMDELGNYEREQKLGIERTYTPKEEALQTMGESAASYNKQMSAIRKEEIEIALDDKMPEREKRLARRKLELERAALAKEFNSEFVKAMEAADRKK